MEVYHVLGQISIIIRSCYTYIWRGCRLCSTAQGWNSPRCTSISTRNSRELGTNKTAAEFTRNSAAVLVQPLGKLPQSTPLERILQRFLWDTALRQRLI